MNCSVQSCCHVSQLLVAIIATVPRWLVVQQPLYVCCSADSTACCVMWNQSPLRLLLCCFALPLNWRTQTKLSSAFKEYRLLHGAHVRNPGALIYPSTLRYLPAHVLGLIKSAAFRCGGCGCSCAELIRTCAVTAAATATAVWPTGRRGEDLTAAHLMPAYLLNLLLRPSVFLPACLLLKKLPVTARCRGSGRDVGADERCAASFALMAATVDDTLRLAYPDVYLLTDAPGSTWGVQEQGKVWSLCRCMPEFVQ
jgi:hypothetical protein